MSPVGVDDEVLNWLKTKKKMVMKKEFDEKEFVGAEKEFGVIAAAMMSSCNRLHAVCLLGYNRGATNLTIEAEMTDALEDHLADLLPVSQWVYYLYRVKFYASQEAADADNACRVMWAASTDAHIHDEIQQINGRHWFCYMEELVCQVDHPMVVGYIHGRAIHESANSHGEREAKKRGLTL